MIAPSPEWIGNQFFFPDGPLAHELNEKLGRGSRAMVITESVMNAQWLSSRLNTERLESRIIQERYTQNELTIHVQSPVPQNQPVSFVVDSGYFYIEGSTSIAIVSIRTRQLPSQR